MFKAIQAYTETKIAHSAIGNVMSPAPKPVDEMESFWLAETLKYFYLLYPLCCGTHTAWCLRHQLSRGAGTPELK
jgi:hypothetical protein